VGKGLLDTDEGLLNFGRVDGSVVKTFEDGDSLLLTALGCEPSRCLGNDGGGKDKDGDEDELEEDGDSPDLASGKTAVTKGIVNPVGNNDA